MARYLYSELASLVNARANCAKLDAYGNMVNPKWFVNHERKAEQLVKDYMPHGSGFDSGTRLDFDSSHGEKLVFLTDYHHMDENGFYDGWTSHAVTVTPSFNGINLRISGRNRNDIKEYIHQAFDVSLSYNLEETWQFTEDEIKRLTALGVIHNPEMTGGLARSKASHALDEFHMRGIEEAI